MSASSAFSGYGTAFQLGDGGGTPTYTTVAEVITIGGPDFKRPAIDVTHMQSDDGFREFIAGRPMGDTITLDLNWTAGTTQTDLLDNVHQQTLANTIRPYRIVFPDQTQSTTVTFANGGTTATATSHGLNTAHPVRFTTSGALPSNITAGKIYFARRTAANTFTVHATTEAATAGTGAITFASSGTGTHSVKSGTVFTFNALCTGFTPNADIENQVRFTAEFKITGKVTIGP